MAGVDEEKYADDGQAAKQVPGQVVENPEVEGTSDTVYQEMSPAEQKSPKEAETYSAESAFLTGQVVDLKSKSDGTVFKFQLYKYELVGFKVKCNIGAGNTPSNELHSFWGISSYASPEDAYGALQTLFEPL